MVEIDYRQLRLADKEVSQYPDVSRLISIGFRLCNNDNISLSLLRDLTRRINFLSQPSHI